MKINFLSNLGAKVALIIVAAGFWVFISFQQGRVGTFPKEIEIKPSNIRGELMAVLSERNVKVKISAQPQIWQTLSSDSFIASLDLQGKSDGIYQVPVKVSVDNPTVQILKVMPDKIQVSIEKIQNFEMKIDAQFEGAPSKEYAVTGYKVEPSTAIIKTSESIFKKISKISVKVKVNDEQDDFSRIYNLTALDNQGNSIDFVLFEPSEVKVFVQIGQSGNVKTVGVKAQISDAPRSGFFIKDIAVIPSVIAISGQANTIYDVTYVETKTISVADRNADFEVETALNLPNGIQEVENIGKVTVKISVAENWQEKTLKISSINFTGLAGGLKVGSKNPNWIEVKVRGNSQAMSTLSDDAASLNVNLSDIKSEGRYKIALMSDQLALPNGIEFLNFVPTELEVSITR